MPVLSELELDSDDRVELELALVTAIYGAELEPIAGAVYVNLRVFVAGSPGRWPSLSLSDFVQRALSSLAGREQGKPVSVNASLERGNVNGFRLEWRRLEAPQ